MNERIIDLLSNRNVRQIVIYPFGKEGKRLAEYIETMFGGIRILRLDAKISKSKDAYICLDDIGNFKDQLFIISTCSEELKRVCTHILLDKGVRDSQIYYFHEIKSYDLDNMVWHRPNFNEEYVKKRIRMDSENPNRFVSDLEQQAVIVSLTSFPGRINHIVPTIKSLLEQDYDEYRVVLWLAKSEFACGIPREIEVLQSSKFEIMYCENLYSYKKLIPAIKSFPESIIITADDDILYKREWLSELMGFHLKYPTDIIANRVTKFELVDEVWRIYTGGELYYSDACFLNKLTGCGGVLYPPGIFDSIALDEQLYLNVAKTSDDLWFWLMGVRNGNKVRVTEKNISLFEFREELKVTPSLTNINDHGEKMFWIHFHNILHLFPEVKVRLINAQNERR